jgi:hypothetical protein
MCLNEIYSSVHIGKNLFNKFTVQNGLKQGHDFITIAFQLCFGICHQEGPRETGRRMRWAGHVVCMGEERVLMGKPE